MLVKKISEIFDLLGEYFVFMVMGLLFGFYMANYDPQTYHQIITYNVMDWLGSHLTIDFLMRESVITGFFGLIMSHILLDKLEGKFVDRSTIMQPMIGAIGGVIGPIVLYISLVLIFGFNEALKAFPVVAATDIAFSLLTGSINYARKSNTIRFLEILAIADDIVIILLSLFIPNSDHPFNVLGVPLIVGLLFVTWVIFKFVNIPWQQLFAAIIMSVLVWNALLFTGLHPILTFVMVLPFVVKLKPAADQASGRKALRKFEKLFKRPVDIGLFGFGFVAGGIELVSFDIFFAPFTLIVLVSIVVGKAVFIPLFARFAKGNAYSTSEQVEAGILAGVGFTVSILMAQLLLKDQPILRDQATVAAVMSLLVVVTAQLLFRMRKFLIRGNFKKDESYLLSSFFGQSKPFGV